MDVRFTERINPEVECILLLERRFQPSPEEAHNIHEIRVRLSEKYDIPLFELDSLLQPLKEVEDYVNSNLNVSEDRLRFFFTVRSNGPASLAWALFSTLKTGIRFGALPEDERLQALSVTLSRIMDIDQTELSGLSDLDQLMHFLLNWGCSEDVKWVCTALYYSIDDYLEELDVILRKATALFLECLPDLSGQCHKTIAFARSSIGNDPERMFSGLEVASQIAKVTVTPCLIDRKSVV